jgi:hypothetical protein
MDAGTIRDEDTTMGRVDGKVALITGALFDAFVRQAGAITP